MYSAIYTIARVKLIFRNYNNYSRTKNLWKFNNIYILKTSYYNYIKKRSKVLRVGI